MSVTYLKDVDPKENHGIVLYELLTEKNSDAKRTGLALARVKPGVSMTQHRHFVTEEQYYFTSGEGIMSLGGKDFPVSNGSAVNIPPGTKHVLKNTGDTDLEFIVISSPHYDPKDEEAV